MMVSAGTDGRLPGGTALKRQHCKCISKQAVCAKG